MTESSGNRLEKAAELRKQADRVMEELQIRQQWEKVGKTVMVGSVCFGLMTTSNLDFEIYVDEPDIRMGFDAVRELAAVPGVEQIQFLNFMGTSDPGLYWRIDYRDRQGFLFIEKT